MVSSVWFHVAGDPYEREWHADCSEPALNILLKQAWRTLECCTHDTYMDCPYYEQMM